MAVDSCPICLRAFVTAPTPFGEFALCESCVRGNFANNLGHVGVDLSSIQESVRVSRDRVHQRLKVHAHMTELHGRRADIAALGVGGKLMEFFSPRAKTGDDIFDAHVRATSDDDTWLGQLLASDAVRTACLEIVTKAAVKFEIRGAHVDARAQGAYLDGTDLVELTRGVAVVVRQMAVLEGRWVARG